MAQSKLPKDIFALAEALLGLFMTGNKPFHLVAKHRNLCQCVCIYLMILLQTTMALWRESDRMYDWDKDF